MCIIGNIMKKIGKQSNPKVINRKSMLKHFNVNKPSSELFFSFYFFSLKNSDD